HGIRYVKLPSASSASSVLRFLENMCQHLESDSLFSSQPFNPYSNNTRFYNRTKSGNNASSWSVDDVIRFVQEADPQTLGPHVDLFRKHVSISEIDGKALMLLRSDVIMKYMGLKLGPALKLCHHIEKLKQTKH
ncbi:Sex comb on midleg-like protein 4, partial [Xenoophorus captivus]